MFERFKNRSEDTNGHGGRTAVAERPVDEREGATRGRDEEGADMPVRDEESVSTHRRPAARAATAPTLPTRDRMHAARARQREEYGGINWGAAFFGWLVAVGLGALLVAILAAAGAILGSEYNVLNQLNLPALPVGKDTMTTGAVIALILVVVGTLLAAIVGGKAGERYHRKVDRLGYTD